MTNITTQDSYFGSFVSPKTSYTFNPVVKLSKNLPMSYFPENIHVVINFAVHYDVQFINRSVYNLSDLIKDVGGLVTGVHGIFLIIVTIIQFQDIHFFMVSKLYSNSSKN